MARKLQTRIAACGNCGDYTSELTQKEGGYWHSLCANCGYEWETPGPKQLNPGDPAKHKPLVTGADHSFYLTH